MKPFLKWAGNKYQIIDRIKAVLPKGSRLIEPFIGSGAVFLNTNYPDYLLADANPDLINLYQYLKSHGQSFINECQKFFVAENNVEQKFYKFRSQFNTTEDRYLKSQLFIYLNKHCFNGLCRYNSKGGFNTPFGKYKKTYFPAKEMENFHRRAQQAVFKHADFLTIMHAAKDSDVIYCDPPYMPLSKTASFTSYSANGFTEQQQIVLAKTAEELAAKNITVIISNHDTEFTRYIYRTATIHSFDVQRFISSDGAKRNKVSEVLAVFC